MASNAGAGKTGLIFFPAFDWAISPTHPERQERLLYTQDQLREEGVFDIPGVTELKPDLATAEDVARCISAFPTCRPSPPPRISSPPAGPSGPPARSWKRRPSGRSPWCVRPATTP